MESISGRLCLCHLEIRLFSQNLPVPSVPRAHLELGAADGLWDNSGQVFDRGLLGAIWRMSWQPAKAQFGNLSRGRTCAQVLGMR